MVKSRWFSAVAITGSALAVVGSLTAGSAAATGRRATTGSPAAAAAVPAGRDGAGSSARVRILARGGRQSSPDDITELGNRLYVSFQNGVGPLGQAAAGGGRSSTIVEFTLGGRRLRQWNVVGKCDGLSADPAGHRLIGTVNEDGHSGLFTLRPAGVGTVTHYRYSGLPHGGGTDSISVIGRRIFVAASAPTPARSGAFTKPALYQVRLVGHRAVTRAVLRDDAMATDAVTGKRVRLNLADPDSTEVVPAGASRFAGDLLLTSQGDAEQIYLSHPGTPQQQVTVLTVGTQVNDTAFATSRRGTLYVTDNTANTLDAIPDTFPRGTVWTGAPHDSGVAGFIGTLNLTTGVITPIAVGFGSPAGLLFRSAR